VVFSVICKDCEQKERNDKKNANRPLATIRQRAMVAARNAEVPFEFIWQQMNYRALVAEFRAALEPDALCRSCGHKFLNERDIQIEHTLPPRHKQDWARLHARTLHFVCASCNRTKGNKSYAEWADEQEDARLSNLSDRSQFSLWNDGQGKLPFGTI
jgi:hypothetical protein